MTEPYTTDLRALANWLQQESARRSKAAGSGSLGRWRAAVHLSTQQLIWAVALEKLLEGKGKASNRKDRRSAVAILERQGKGKKK